MRILVVPKWYPTAERPAFGAFCKDHALALARQHEVVVLASYATRRPPFTVFRLEQTVDEGLLTFRLYYRRPRLRPAAFLCQVAGMVRAFLWLARRGRRPQVVHAHVYSAGLPAALLARPFGARLVISEHYTGFARGLVRGIERCLAKTAYNAAHLVAPVSAELARRLRETAPRARYVVVPNPVNCDLFQPAKDDGLREPTLLCVAALVEKKGHRYLFAALARLAEEGTALPPLALVGEGELRAELEALAAAGPLAESVTFYGELPRSEVAQLMGKASLLVLPSLYENLPCVLLEALASGLPFVATAVGGVPSLFAELAVARSCFLVPPGAPAPLAQAIKRALARLPTADRAGLTRLARERFSYERIAHQWTALYETLR